MIGYSQSEKSNKSPNPKLLLIYQTPGKNEQNSLLKQPGQSLHGKQLPFDPSGITPANVNFEKEELIKLVRIFH